MRFKINLQTKRPKKGTTNPYTRIKKIKLSHHKLNPIVKNKLMLLRPQKKTPKTKVHYFYTIRHHGSKKQTFTQSTHVSPLIKTSFTFNKKHSVPSVRRQLYRPENVEQSPDAIPEKSILPCSPIASTTKDPRFQNIRNLLEDERSTSDQRVCSSLFNNESSYCGTSTSKDPRFSRITALLNGSCPSASTKSLPTTPAASTSTSMTRVMGFAAGAVAREVLLTPTKLAGKFKKLLITTAMSTPNTPVILSNPEQIIVDNFKNSTQHQKIPKSDSSISNNSNRNVLHGCWDFTSTIK